MKTGVWRIWLCGPPPIGRAGTGFEGNHAVFSRLGLVTTGTHVHMDTKGKHVAFVSRGIRTACMLPLLPVINGAWGDSWQESGEGAFCFTLIRAS